MTAIELSGNTDKIFVQLSI